MTCWFADIYEKIKDDKCCRIHLGILHCCITRLLFLLVSRHRLDDFYRLVEQLVVLYRDLRLPREVEDGSLLSMFSGAGYVYDSFVGFVRHPYTFVTYWSDLHTFLNRNRCSL